MTLFDDQQTDYDPFTDDSCCPLCQRDTDNEGYCKRCDTYSPAAMAAADEEDNARQTNVCHDTNTKERTETMTTLTPTDSNAQKAQSLQDISRGLLSLLDTATPAIDADQITAIVQAQITAALAEQAPRRVQIEIGHHVSQDMEGPLPINFFRIVKLLNARQNTLLVGPAGCGKTHVARLAAEALGLDFASISLTAGMSEGALTGRLLPIGEGGRFEYVRSEFVRMYEEGGIFLLDELDAADPNTLLVINTALANGHMPVPARVDKPSASRHADFVCVSTANTYGQGANREYAARDQIDASTLDRFAAGVVTCDYDANVEQTLVDERLLTWGRRMRERINATNLRRLVSTRFLLDGTRLLATKMASWDSLMDSYFASWKADERAKAGDLCPAEPYDILRDNAKSKEAK